MSLSLLEFYQRQLQVCCDVGSSPAPTARRSNLPPASDDDLNHARDDETAVAWLLSESTVVQVQAINAIPITEIAALAKSYTAQEQFQRASELYYAVILSSTEVSNADRIEFCKLQLSAVQQMPADERNPKDTLATTKSAMIMFSTCKTVRGAVVVF